MKTVKAKFQCSSVTLYEGVKETRLYAVCSDKGENKDFTEYTPSGELRIMINKDTPASEFFIPGKDYYLTFEEAPES